MTRRFQIWSQNLNRITFDPLFGKKTVENWILLVNGARPRSQRGYMPFLYQSVIFFY